MDNTLSVTMTQTFDGHPLATVRNLPGADADLRPEQMRALAKALCKAADECEKRPMDKKHFTRCNRGYDMTTPNV